MSREHHYRIALTWAGPDRGPTTSYQAYSREYLVEIAGKPALKGSADPQFRGDPALHNPEEWLVAALSSCHMLSFLAEASRTGVSVLAYSDAAESTMTFEGGHGQFSAVTLHPRVVVAAGTDADLVRRLHDQAHEACFIARSVNFPVHHAATVEIDAGV